MPDQYVVQFSNPKQEELNKSLNLFPCHLLIQNFKIVRNLLIVPGRVKFAIVRIEILQLRW